MRVVWLLGPVFALTGCFAPSFEDCQLACPGNGACPEGFACIAGFCQAQDDPALSCQTVDEPDAGERVADAHTETPEHDAMARPDAGLLADATPVDPTCNLSVVPPALACGGSVLCARKLEGITVKARVVYAREVKTQALDAECMLESADDPTWQAGAGDDDLWKPFVTADVIYAEEVRATRITATEVRAQEIDIGW